MCAHPSLQLKPPPFCISGPFSEHEKRILGRFVPLRSRQPEPLNSERVIHWHTITLPSIKHAQQKFMITQTQCAVTL